MPEPTCHESAFWQNLMAEQNLSPRLVTEPTRHEPRGWLKVVAPKNMLAIRGLAEFICHELMFWVQLQAFAESNMPHIWPADSVCHEFGGTFLRPRTCIRTSIP